jgi:hypothetical protein
MLPNLKPALFLWSVHLAANDALQHWWDSRWCDLQVACIDLLCCFILLLPVLLADQCEL